MRRITLVLTIVILAVGAWLYLGREPATPPPVPTNAPAVLPVISSAAASAPAAIIASNPSPAPTRTPPLESPPSASNSLSIDPALAFLASTPPDVSPEVILGNMRNAIRLYASMLGGNPVGNNQEITRSLNGENSKHTKFLRPEAGLRVNSNGELVEPWGTPFFFHQLSGNEMEIRSAGPDRRMWTLDDLVVK